MGGTSREYLRKRLLAVGRNDLVEAAENGLVSWYSAAEEAHLITRRPTLGTGSGNQARRRRWAIARATGQAPPLAPKPEPQPETGPVSPLPQEIRDIVVKLVEAGRADLIISVAERRLTPHQAARISDQGERRTVVSKMPPAAHRKAKRAEPEPEQPRYDVKAMIA